MAGVKPFKLSGGATGGLSHIPLDEFRAIVSQNPRITAKHWQASDLTVEDSIGHGSYGEVKLVTNNKEGGECV